MAGSKEVDTSRGWGRGCVGGRFFLVGGGGRVGIDQRGRLIDGVTVVAET